MTCRCLQELVSIFTPKKVRAIVPNRDESGGSVNNGTVEESSIALPASKVSGRTIGHATPPR